MRSSARRLTDTRVLLAGAAPAAPSDKPGANRPASISVPDAGGGGGSGKEAKAKKSTQRRLLSRNDIKVSLKGRRLQLLWPEDQTW